MKPRKLHWRMSLAHEETACGKTLPRVRYCMALANWDSKVIAGGRRCPDCAKVVEVTRRKAGGDE